MLEFAQTLYMELLSALEQLDGSSASMPFSADERLGLINKAIVQLKEKLMVNSFIKKSDEICFFKHLLPKTLSLLIYYPEKFDLEALRMFGTPGSRIKYIDRISARINAYFEENADFIKYYWAGKTDLDNSYFLRKNPGHLDNRDWLTAVMDPLFCNPNTIKVATILAYSRLEKEIDQFVQMKPVHLPQAGAEVGKLEWTDTKMGLIELIYSLKEQGSFNNGNADLKNITSYFERVFSVELGNISSGFQKILTRKNGHTHYIDQLKDKLDFRMEQLAEGNS